MNQPENSNIALTRKIIKFEEEKLKVEDKTASLASSLVGAISLIIMAMLFKTIFDSDDGLDWLFILIVAIGVVGLIFLISELVKNCKVNANNKQRLNLAKSNIDEYLRLYGNPLEYQEVLNAVRRGEDVSHLKLTSPESMELAKMSKELSMIRKERESKPQQNQPKCSKCNGTQFTPVRKKFSLLTGFATNKIEMVCNNCGTVRKS